MYFQSLRSFRRNNSSKRGEVMTDGSPADQNPVPAVPPPASNNAYQVDGRKAWLVVFGTFLANLVALGMLYAFGIFVIPLSEEFNVSRAEVSLIGTINNAFFYVAGVFSGPLADKFGVKPIVTIGAIIWVAGVFLASITESLWQQILTQAILIGLGTAFVFWPTMSVVPQWFSKYRGTAVGLAALGSGIGNLIFALGGQSIINALGWRNTLRVLGGLGAFLLSIVILLVERRVPAMRKGGLFDVSKSLIKLNSYRWFLLCTFLFQWGFFVPFVHLAAYTKDMGIDSTYQGLAVAMLGVGSSVGRVAIGPLADKVGRMITFRVCMFLTAGTLACWPACQDASSIMAFAFFYAFFAGGFSAQAPVVAGDLYGVNNLGGTFALVNLVMVPGGLASGPLAGLVYERYGSYWGAIWGASIFLFLSSCCLLMVRKEKKIEVSSPQTTTEQTSPTQQDDEPSPTVQPEEEEQSQNSPSEKETASNSQQPQPTSNPQPQNAMSLV